MVDLQSVLVGFVVVLALVLLVVAVKQVANDHRIQALSRQYGDVYLLARDAVFAAALENNEAVIQQYKERAALKNVDPFILLAVDRVDAALQKFGIDIPEEVVVNMIAAILIQHEEFPHAANTPLLEKSEDGK